MRDHEAQGRAAHGCATTLKPPIPKADIQKGCPMPGDVPMDNVDRSLTATGAEMQRCAEATAIQ